MERVHVAKRSSRQHVIEATRQALSLRPNVHRDSFYQLLNAVKVGFFSKGTALRCGLGASLNRQATIHYEGKMSG